MNAITQSSDSRYKTDIVPLSNSLFTVNQLNPVYYTLVNHPKRQIGFIAQELETVYPELVHTDSSEDKMKSISYANLTAVLVDSVKELYGEIRALQSTVKGVLDNK